VGEIKMHLKNLKERNQLRDGRIILKADIRELGVRFWTGFIWLRIERSGDLL
jgi:hypothetical protein